MTHPHRTCRPTRRRAWLLATAPLAFALIMLAGVAYVMADDGATESATDDGAKATDAIEEKTESETPASDAESSEVTESEVAKVGTADEPAESTPSETPGQSLLGDATRARLTASNFRDLNEVVRLLDEAIKKGLDEASTKIARQMLAGTLLERGRTVTGAILTQHRRNRRWPEMRRMAVGDLRRVLKVDQQNVEAHFLLSQLWLMPGGDRTAALESLDIVVAREDAPAKMRAKALLLRAELQSDDQQRLADYQQAIDLVPDNVEAFRARAAYHLTQGRNDEALIDINRNLELDSEDANNHLARGTALFVMQDYDEALASFDRATELAPKVARPYEHRARIYALKNDAERALEQLDKGLELEPRSITMLLLRAQIRQMTDDTDGALADVDQAIKLAPNSLSALQMRALILANSGKREEAIKDLRRLSSALPDNIELLSQLGELYMADGQLSRSVKLFDAILATDSKNWQALRSRGDVLLNMGKQREAIADFEAALKIQGEHSGLLNNLAWVLSTSPDESLRNGSRALELAMKACEASDYKRAHILSTLAAAYAETGDFETAVKWSKKSVEMGDELHDQQLSEELKSYEAGRPWREQQSAEDKVEANEQSDPWAEPASAQLPESQLPESPSSESQPSETPPSETQPTESQSPDSDRTASPR